MDENRALKKAHEATHITSRLSLRERKIFNALLWHAYPKLLKYDTHEISRKELGALIGDKTRNFGALQAALDRLNTTQIKLIRFEGTRKEEITFFTFLASGKLQGGVVEYAFAPHMRDVLYHPKFYTKFFLEMQRKFASYQALALYENCKRFQAVGSTGVIAIGLWRKLLGIDKVPSYANFKVLNQKVIRKAVQEINRLSDIHITPDFLRRSRKVVGIRFWITKNKQLTLFEGPDEEEERDELFAEVIAKMTSEQRVELEERFEREVVLMSSTLRARFDKEGYASRTVQIALQDFVLGE